MSSTAISSISTKIQDTGARHVRKAKSFLIQRIKGNTSAAALPISNADETTTVAAAAASTNALPQYSIQVDHESGGQQRAPGTGPSAVPPLLQVPASGGAKFRDLFTGPTLRRTASSFLRAGRRGANGDCCSAQRPTLGILFFGLPLELKLEIVNLLPFNDIMTLRRTSRSFRNLIADHESHIVKQHIKIWVPKYISILYPSPPDIPPTLRFLGGVAQRQRISTQLAIYLAEQIVKEMGQSRRMKKKPLSAEVIGYVVDQLRHGMAPLILALFHFLETYRQRKMDALLDADLEDRLAGAGGISSAQETRDLHLQSDILLQYPDCLLLQIHQMYHLLLHLFLRRLTPPPIWLSRTPLGRWNHTPLGPNRPSDEAFAKVLLLGGIGEVWRLYKIKGHGKRRRALDKYIKKVDQERKSPKSPSTGPSPTRSAATTSLPPPPQLPIDELSNLWVPAAEKQLLGRNLVPTLDAVSCCGEFVAELLGNDDTTTDLSSSSDESYDSSDEHGVAGGADGHNTHIMGNPAFGMFTRGMHFGSFHLRLADDANWDDDLIEEQEDGEDDDWFEEGCCGEDGKPGLDHKREHGNGEGPSTSIPKGGVVLGGSVGGSGANVPLSGGGYQKMGGSLLSIVS